MIRSIVVLCCATVLGALNVGQSVAADATLPQYRMVASIPLGAPERWDCLTFDASANRVYISHRTRIDVVDVAQGKVVGTVPGLAESHGVIVVPDTGRGYADDGAAKNVTIFDTRTLAPVGTAAADTDADAIVYDALTHRIFVMNADGQSISVIDTKTNKNVKTMPLGGAPEFAEVDGKGKLFIAIASTNEVIVFDTRSLSVTTRWSVPACERPHGVAMDRATNRLFVSCANARLQVLDAASGAVVADLPIGKGSDAVVFDARRKLIFSSNSDGTLSVVSEKNAATFVALGDIKTAPGARTMALDPSNGRIFLVAADVVSTEPPKEPGHGPHYVYAAGSTKLLVFETGAQK